MGDEDDFTFCKVAPPLDGVEAQNFADGIKEISIGDGNGNSVSSNPESGTIWRDGASSQKQETVGSLSFSVMDASSSRRDVDQRPKLAAQEGAGSSTQSLPEKKAPAKKSASRAKVPFEKGYSQMDWLKLTRTHPDLAGLKGQSNKRLITLSEVKQHRSEGSMWTVLKGRVYNLAPYLKFHPGGEDILMKAVGKDCTSLFNKYHAWVNAEFLLEKCLVGILDDSSK